MDVRAAFTKMKEKPDVEVFFAYFEQEAKPHLLVDTKKVQASAFPGGAQNKCLGHLTMPNETALDITPAGTAPSAKILKDGFKKLASGINLKLETITVKGGDAPQAAPEDPQLAAAFEARFKAFLPVYAKAIAHGGPTVTALKSLFEKCKEAFEGKHYQLAGDILKKLEPAAKQLVENPSTTEQGHGEEAHHPAATDVVFHKLWKAASKNLQHASDVVDGQLSKLQSALRDTDDPALWAIADQDIDDVIGDYTGPLLAVTREVAKASGPGLKPATAKAQTIVNEFKGYLDKEDTVGACDHNKFGVTVTIRKTLGDALEQLDKVLAAAPK
jgi:hypothetical protein